MPVSKKISQRAALEALHARIARREGGVGRVFRPREDGHETAKLLKILEDAGRVLNVPTVGWVNSEPALERYRESTVKIAQIAHEQAERAALEREEAESAVMDPGGVCTSRYNEGGCDCEDDVPF